MKVRSLLVSMLCMLALSVSFASCSDDDDLLDDSGSTVALPQVRAFFLNAGTQGANNANIAFYAPNGGADFIGDIFCKKNAKTFVISKIIHIFAPHLRNATTW